MPAGVTRILAAAACVAALPGAPTANAQDTGGNCSHSTVTINVQSQGTTGRGAVEATTTRTQSVETCYGSADDALATSGGGSGGQSRCTTEPVGDPAEVYAVYAAVNAEQTPEPQNTAFVEDEIQNPGGPNRVVNASWYRIDGTSVQILYSIECDDPPESYSRWMTVSPDASGTFTPRVNAVDLLPALQARVVRQLPTPIPIIGPADENPNRWTFVQIRTNFWIDQAPGQWATVSGTAGAGGITVSVQAVPVRLVVDPGDGTEPVVCEGAPVPVTRSTYTRNQDRGCAHIYRDSSAMAANGESFPVTATIVWHATWSASTGEGGDLGYVSTTSPIRDLPVAERQAVIVATEP